MLDLLKTRRLSRREGLGVLAAGAVLLCFLFFQFILFPVMDKRARLNRILAFKVRTLIEVQRLSAEYQGIQKQTDRLKKRYAGRPRGFTLFSFLDKLARQTGVKDHIAYMKPSSTVQKENNLKISTVEMKLQTINLPKLTEYLYRIETSKLMLTVHRASFVKKGKDGNGIDVVLQVHTIDI